jgi:hypothetical protein
MTVTSSSPIFSSRTMIPLRRRPCSAMTSIGVVASTHFAPCRAAAARPAMTPRRPVHNHVAIALAASVGSAPRGR